MCGRAVFEIALNAELSETEAQSVVEKIAKIFWQIR